MERELTNSLNQLEGRDWGPPPLETHLVEAVHRVRQKPIGELTVEELRIAIGQQVGLKWLLPLAVGQLAVDPWCEGDLFPGDLLLVVLRVDESHWRSDPDRRRQLATIARRALAGSGDPDLEATGELRSLLERFANE